MLEPISALMIGGTQDARFRLAPEFTKETTMTTHKQRAANRSNAENSTGPTTIEGRNRSKLNALKHGLTAAQIIVFDESAKDLEKFHQGLIEQMLPLGALEEQLVERIAIC